MTVTDDGVAPSLAEHLLTSGPALDFDSDEPGQIEARELWRVEDDSGAAWALRKIKAAEDLLGRYKADLTHEIDNMKMWYEAACHGPQSTIDTLTSKLVDYRRTLEFENDDLSLTYKVPGGALTRRKPPDRVEVTDVDAFLDWARENHPSAVKETPLVGQLGPKHGYHPQREKDDPPGPAPLVSGDGETVPGVVHITPSSKYGAVAS